MGQSAQKRYSYQYGSEAKNYYQPIPRPIIEPEYQPSVAPQKRTDVVFGLKLSLCGITIFACAFIYIYMYSSLITKQGQLQALKNDIREMKSAVSLTESQISEKLNLDHIRYRASNELGMSEPLPHQIVYIQLPKQSYTLYNQ